MKLAIFSLRAIFAILLIMVFSSFHCPVLAQADQSKKISWKYYGSYAKAANEKKQYKRAAQYILKAVQLVDTQKDGRNNPALIQILGHVYTDTTSGLLYDCILGRTPWVIMDSFILEVMKIIDSKFGPNSLEFYLAHLQVLMYDSHSETSGRHEVAMYWKNRQKQRKRNFTKSEKKILSDNSLYIMKKQRISAKNAYKKRYPTK